MTASKARKATAARKTCRCAICTRKSTEEGLDQDFNSLDAQREAAEAYIKSQAHQGWVRLPERYDDGGFTGGNMDRPALARLLADIEAGRIDVVIVHRVQQRGGVGKGTMACRLRTLLAPPFFDSRRALDPAAHLGRPCAAGFGPSCQFTAGASCRGDSPAPHGRGQRGP